MKVQKIMTTRTSCINANSDLNAAALLMWEDTCAALPVKNNNNQIVGMISDRDIALAALMQGRDLRKLKVVDVMSRALVSCNENDEVVDVENIMRSQNVRRVPVLGSDQQLVGMVAMTDIALAYKKMRLGRTDYFGETTQNILPAMNDANRLHN